MKYIENKIIKNYWENLENKKIKPTYANKIVTLDYSEFKKKFNNKKNLFQLI